MDQNIETTEELSGRKAVRVLVVQRLAAAGLIKNKRCKTEAEHSDMMRRLVDHLAYLTRPSLDLLADEILTSATGKGRNQWPDEAFVRLLAEGKEARPGVLPEIVSNWLASVEGPQAQAGGYLVEMYRHLCRRKRVLTPYDRVKIKEQAAENRRTQQLIAERQRDGIDRSEDRHWLGRYQADQQSARAIVDRGQQARVAREDAE